MKEGGKRKWRALNLGSRDPKPGATNVTWFLSSCRLSPLPTIPLPSMVQLWTFLCIQTSRGVATTNQGQRNWANYRAIEKKILRNFLLHVRFSGPFCRLIFFFLLRIEFRKTNRDVTGQESQWKSSRSGKVREIACKVSEIFYFGPNLLKTVLCIVGIETPRR